MCLCLCAFVCLAVKTAFKSMNIKTEANQTLTHEDFAFVSNYLSLCFNDEKYIFSLICFVILKFTLFCFQVFFCLFQAVFHYVGKSGLELVAISLPLNLEY